MCRWIVDHFSFTSHMWFLLENDIAFWYVIRGWAGKKAKNHQFSINLESSCEYYPVLTTHIWIVVVDTPHQISRFSLFVCVCVLLLFFFLFCFCWFCCALFCWQRARHSQIHSPYASPYFFFFFGLSVLYGSTHQAYSQVYRTIQKLCVQPKCERSEERVPKLWISIQMVCVWMRFLLNCRVQSQFVCPWVKTCSSLIKYTTFLWYPRFGAYETVSLRLFQRVHHTRLVCKYHEINELITNFIIKNEWNELFFSLLLLFDCHLHKAADFTYIFFWFGFCVLFYIFFFLFWVLKCINMASLWCESLCCVCALLKLRTVFNSWDSVALISLPHRQKFATSVLSCDFELFNATVAVIVTVRVLFIFVCWIKFEIKKKKLIIIIIPKWIFEDTMQCP